MIYQLAAGEIVPNLIAGVHDAIATRIFAMVGKLKIEPDVAITGGGAKNIGLVKALESAVRLSRSRPAGAPSHRRTRRRPDRQGDLRGLRVTDRAEPPKRSDQGWRKRRFSREREVARSAIVRGDARMGSMHSLGIDIGSGFSEGGRLSGRRRPVERRYAFGRKLQAAAEKVADAALEEAGLSFGRTVAYCGHGLRGGNGRFRRPVGHRHLLSRGRGPPPLSLREDGRRYGRAIQQGNQARRSGKITNFVLNEKCAGGSGKFLQVIARILHIDVEEIGALSLGVDETRSSLPRAAPSSPNPRRCRASRRGALPADILAGVHRRWRRRSSTW